ncbi:MAG: hypothetical protein ABIT83_08420 [Massilia sp.]
MNIQQHARIEQIKKLSGSMRRLLSLIAGLLWLFWPVLGVLAFVICLPGNKAGPSVLEGVGILLLGVALLVLTQKTVRYSRDLMAHFSEGDIFNSRTLHTARKALLYSLTGLAIDMGFGIYSAFTPMPVSALEEHDTIASIFELTSKGFNGFMFFGLMFVMLWTLEIGRDLYEESELTI